MTVLACGHAPNATATVEGEQVPACAICLCHAPAVVQPDLTGRKARCTCGKLRPSSPDLAFFEYRGEGSRDAVMICGRCGYYEVAHLELHPVSRVCDSFTPRGARQYDSFYCGHAGWD